MVTAETYLGKIVVEDIRVRAVAADPESAPEGEIETTSKRGELTWMRDAAGWRVLGAAQLGTGHAEERNTVVAQTAVLVAMVAACFRHGYRVTVTISELCG